MAACAIIDDVCQTAKEEDDSFDQTRNVTVSAMAAKTADKRGKIERNTRPSGTLKGWRRLIEICTEEDSCLGLTSEEFENVSVTRITKEIDWRDEETVQQTKELIKSNPGTSLHGSLPCTVWCNWQSINEKKLGEEYRKDRKAQKIIEKDVEGLP